MAGCGCCSYCCGCECRCHGQPGVRGPGGSGQPGTGGPGAGSLPWPLPKVGTWLLIRYDSADLGARPIPAGDVWWESPDIWLTGGDEYGNPIGGQPANVFARVWNLGALVAMPVRVDFFFIAPSLGILPSAPERIGTKEKPAAWTVVPPLSAVEVACPVPWIPPVTKGNLHACLLATCSAPVTGDVPTVPANPVADRHTGQHNLTVIEAGAAKDLSFTLNLSNLAPRSTRVELMAAASWRPEALTAIDAFPSQPSLKGPIDAVLDAAGSSEHWLWARRAAIILERSTQTYNALPADGVRQALKLTGISPGGIEQSTAVVAPPNRFGAADSSFTALGDTIELKAQQEATASFSITVPQQAPQPWFIVHLAQAANGAVIGGYTVAIGTTRRP